MPIREWRSRSLDPVDQFTLTLGEVPADVAATLSVDVFTTDPPRPGLDGRGAFRLYNASVDASVYVAVMDTAPDGDTSAVRVRPQSWFPIGLQVRPAGGVWAWASRPGTKAAIWVTAWS